MKEYNLDGSAILENVDNEVLEEVIRDLVDTGIAIVKTTNPQQFKTFVGTLREVWGWVIRDKDKINKIAAEVGAYVLNFKTDDLGLVYHSQPETWQRPFGYNDTYDELFDTGGSIRLGKLYFNYDNPNDDIDGEVEHLIWTWRGDYWNLGAGAEVGIYSYDHEYLGYKHYNSIDFELPMTLSYYNISDKNHVESYANWAPTEPQWWITAFNYKHQLPIATELVTLSTLDLSNNKSM